MALNVLQITRDVFKHLKDTGYSVYRQGIPDLDTVKRDANGRVPYYLAVQFGTPQAKARGKTFCGVRHDDYVLPIYIQVVGPDATKVEEVAYGDILDAMLGYGTDWTSGVEQRPGGALYPMTQSNGATEAYVYPLSFGLTFQMNPTP